VLLTALLACLALLVAACGDDDSGSGSDSASSGQTGTEQAAPDTSGDDASSAPADLPPVSKDLDNKPEIKQPEGDPPAELQKIDIVKGDGQAAKEGDNISVQYVGANWSNGQEFDASWGRGEPFEFTLGAGNVIPGWDQGLVGMKEGGRRELVIPPDMGYGPQGTPDGSIPPNETLIFVVDLKKVTRGEG
jgi:peptidylprolyl isomerase